VLRDGRVVLSERGEQVRAFAEVGGAGGNGTTTMWIGTISRLLTWTPDGIVQADPALWRDRSIWALHMARDGSLWVGSERGLFQMVGDSVRSFSETDGLRSPFVASIHEEQDGTLWFGTYEHGLHRYRDGRFAALTTAEGLPHNGVWRMIPDDDGGVWMSSDVGLFRVEHDRLHEVADAIEHGVLPHVKLEPMVFTEAEGMPSREFNRASPGGWRLDDGRILFNNIAGAVVIDPKQVLEPRVPPRTVLRSVTIDGESVELARGTSPVMPAGTKHLSIEFAALSFLAPEQNRYRYRLDGYDDAWVAGGTEHRAQYTNLAPGDYTFRVQGASATGPYGAAEAFSFSLAPFVWQTWWFRLLALGALVMLLMTVHRYRVARLLEMERLRLRIASDLHDDVGSNLSSIALLSEMLKGDARLDELEQRQLQRINRAAEETIGALRDIIWLVAPRHDDLAELVRRMRGVADDMLNGTVSCHFQAERIDTRPLSMAFMRNALLIFKEALHNVVKHARAREVVIRISNDAGIFVLEIADDGSGFDEAAIQPGNGLASMRRRARSTGGELTIDRSASGGTRILFVAKMEQSRDGHRRPLVPR
jgi:signal transduction histidine kinase